MKQITAAIILTIFCSALFAQKDIPGFGKIGKADLEMKDCAFDKAAEAMVLFDVAEVYCFLDLNSPVRVLSSQLERHVRIKILSNKGLDFANIRIPFIAEKNIEDIKNISAQTINLDASGNIVITKIDKKLIYTRKINKRYSELIFAFPDVKAGSIIEYKYKDDADNLYALKNWYFQRSIPVMLSRYILDFPSELIISAQPQGSLTVDTKHTNEGNRNIKTFSLANVPALRNEPFMSCKEDYLQQVIPFLYSLNIPGRLNQDILQTWPKVVKTLMEDDDFGIQLKKNIPRTHDLDVLLENIADPYKKMILIHDYVRKNMEWNNTYGIWALDGVKSAWRDKKGTTGEINLILVNLLKDAGLKAYPILLSTKENGSVNTTIAGYDQFNKVMAYVTIGEKNYVLDATDRSTPIQLIPLNVLHSEGLVIEKFDTYQWGWKVLQDDEHFFKTTTFIDASVNPEGLMTGNANVTSSDYGRLDRTPKLKEGKDKFIQAYFSSNENNLKVDSFLFENAETDSLPLVQMCTFTQSINSSGGYNYFSANLFSGLEKNPFIEDERFTDVFFGAKQLYSITGIFTIPEGYTFDALPRNTRMRLPDTSIVFTRYVSAIDRELSVRFELEYKKPLYTTEEYGMLHEFYKKLFPILNEQFVYKKK